MYSSSRMRRNGLTRSGFAVAVVTLLITATGVTFASSPALAICIYPIQGCSGYRVITQIAPFSAMIASSASVGFTEQLQTTGGNGPVSFRQQSGATELLVSGSGVIATSGSLPTGVYTTAGSTTDATGDVGSFTYTLSVGFATDVSVSLTPDHHGILATSRPLLVQGVVSSPGHSGSTPSGSVSLVINGLASPAAPSAVLNSNGDFHLPLVYLPQTKSPLMLSVRYAGDTAYAPSSSAAFPLHVVASTSTTTLTSDHPKGARYGSQVRFTAHVQAPPSYGATPAGWIEFSVDARPALGLVALGTTHAASWSTSLSPGVHTVVATFVPGIGDGEFTAGTARIKQSVAFPHSKVAAGLSGIPVRITKSPSLGFRVSGTIDPPPGMLPAKACLGTVTEVLSVGSTGGKGHAALHGSCHFDVSATLPAVTKTPTPWSAQVRVAFSGNGLLLASNEAVAIQSNPCAAQANPPAVTATPCGGSSPPWVVTVGDSYISGEGGRWAGNTNGSSGNVDSLGPTAYDDNLTNNINASNGTPGVPVVGSSELIPDCHRSRSDEAFIGGGTPGLDLACSGTGTSTSGSPFTPGIDFYQYGGNIGQALALSDFAHTHPVRMVALGIGGNDFGFGSVVQSCLTDYLTSVDGSSVSYVWFYVNLFDWGWHAVYTDQRDYCSHDPSVTGPFGGGYPAAVQSAVAQDIVNAGQALADQGEQRNNYTIVVQTYPDPLANSSQMRYPQGQDNLSSWLFLDKGRQWTGGCGFWDADVNWMTGSALSTINNVVTSAAAAVSADNNTSYEVFPTSGSPYYPNVKVLNVTNALQGHLLCSNAAGVGLLEETGTPNWTSAGAANHAEWVTQVRTITALLGPYQFQEDLHPNYWGQLALRSCLRDAYNFGSPRGGTCTPASIGGLDAQTPPEPNMQFAP